MFEDKKKRKESWKIVGWSFCFNFFPVLLFYCVGLCVWLLNFERFSFACSGCLNICWLVQRAVCSIHICCASPTNAIACVLNDECVRWASLQVQANEWVSESNQEKNVKTVEYRSYKSCNQHAAMPIKMHIQTYGNENTFIYTPILFYYASKPPHLWGFLDDDVFFLVFLSFAHFHPVHLNYSTHVRAAHIPFHSVRFFGNLF